jgi:hypothetical protein
MLITSVFAGIFVIFISLALSAYVLYAANRGARRGSGIRRLPQLR